MRTLTRTEIRSSHLRTFRLDAVRVVLVPEQAVLLAGDHVTISVRVAAGQALEIVEPGGTVAYAMRGSSARWDVDVEVEAGASLVWHGEPFVVAQGADVRRTTRVDLVTSSRMRLRETLVLGRAGEEPGRLRSRIEVHREGSPVLVEELDSSVGVGGHRVVDQLLWLGGLETGAGRPQPADTLTLQTGDRLQRWLGAATHASPLAVGQSSPRAE